MECTRRDGTGYGFQPFLQGRIALTSWTRPPFFLCDTFVFKFVLISIISIPLGMK